MTTTVLTRRLAEESPAVHERSGRAFDVLCVVLPLGLVWQFNAVGQVFVADAVALALLPFLLHLRRRRTMRPIPRPVILLLCVWLFSQIETDLIRVTPFADYARGWGQIALTLIHLVVIWTLIDGQLRRVILFSASTAAGMLVAALASPDRFTDIEPWKFGFAAPFMLGMATLLSRRVLAKQPLIAIAAFAIAAPLNLVLNFRSMAGICLLVAAILVVQSVIALRGGPVRRSSPVRVGVMLVIATVVTFGFVKAYESTARSGALGDAARKKLEQLSYRGQGVILGGRTDVYVATLAIRDSPLLGHGSWAKDSHYITLLRALRRRGAVREAEPGLIPSHSHLFGAWVQAGLLGAVFWLYVLFLAAGALAELLHRRSHLAPLIAFVAILLAYDILFSPFAAERRLLVPFFVVVLLVSIEHGSRTSFLTAQRRHT